MPERMRRLVLEGAVAVALALTAAQPAFAATIMVNTTADDTTGGNGTCSIREALAASGNDVAQDACPAGSGPDVITVPAGTYTLTQGALAISDNTVTIDGAGQASTVVDAGGGFSLLQNSGPSDAAQLQDLTLQNGTALNINNLTELTLVRVTVTDAGLASGTGGGISNGAAGSLTVVDSSIDANFGKGIFNGGTLTVTNSSVSGNLDSSDMPPNDGGIENAPSGVATIDGSDISDNSGSGIVNLGTLTATDTVIDNNTAGSGAYGGGVSILSNSMAGATTVLDHVTITNNKALSGGGGGIANGSQSTGNPSNLTISDSTIAGNDALSGGGLSSSPDPGTTTIERSTISGNSATGGEGGGISNGATAVTVLTNSTVSGNDVAGQGGGIINGGTSTVSLNFSTISGNTSTASAGGIEGGATLGSTIVANNTGTPVFSRDDCFGPLTSQGYNLIESVDPPGCPIGGDTTGNIIGMDPVLGPLANNGGPTQTHELLSGSPAINAASPSCPPPGTDQRGVVRQPGRMCDIGAFEIAEEPVPVPAQPGEPGDTNPPDTTITKRPKDKTKKKTAVFEFSSSEPGSTFECKLDGGQFAPCSSPDTLKVKKGKHSFEVRAKDAAGNVDGSPASDSWKVKKKRKR